VGCRERATKTDLLRVVVVEEPSTAKAVPDVRGRMPGRGAWLHPELVCLDLAERRRAFPRALRRSGPLDTSPVREHLETRSAGTDQAVTRNDGRRVQAKAGTDGDEPAMSAQQ